MTLGRSRTLSWLSLGTCLMAAGFAGCDDDDDDSDSAGETAGTGAAGGAAGSSDAGSSAGTGAGGSSDAGGSAGTGAGGAGGSGAEPVEVDVAEDITTDTTWTAGNTYLLKKIVYVKEGATLTIEPGVTVLGDTSVAGTITALIVTRGSKIEAEGTADAPIVFTSGNPEGARNPGDWGGVVLLGEATINTGTQTAAGYFENNIEGLDPTLPESLYGGNDDESSAGTLKYVRIEFAGYKLDADNELNGLTLGGVGSGTTLSYIQVNRGSDDGIEFFGGTANFDHIVLTGNSDDSLDFDLGWRGNGQFIVVHQLPNDGDKGFEADNLGENEAAEPRSNPTLYNVTLIGNPEKVGLHLREGVRGTFRNFIITGFATAVNLDTKTLDLTTEWPEHLSIANSVFFDNAAVGSADATDDDGGFNEDEAIKAAALANVFNVDPGLGTDPTAPNYKPTGDVSGKATPPAGFDTSATYAGAVDPEGDDWTLGWTSYAQQ